MKRMKELIIPAPLTLENGKTVQPPKSMALPALIFLLVATAISVEVTGFDFSVLVNRGYEFFTILWRMIPPNLAYLDYIWQPLFDTIKMSVLGSVLGALLAVPFAVLGSSNIVKNKGLVATVRLFFSVVRTLPTLVTALLATYLFGLGTFAGTVAILVFSFAYLGKLLYEQIETVDMGAYEALEAMGATKIRAFQYAILPQVLPGYIANGLFCFEGNVRYASILGYVGAGGLGMILSEKIGWQEYDKVGMILLALFVTVAIIEIVSHAIRKKLT